MFGRRRSTDTEEDLEQRRADLDFLKPFRSSCHPSPSPFTKDEIAVFLNERTSALELKTYLAPPCYSYQDLASFLAQAQGQFRGPWDNPRQAQSKSLLDGFQRPSQWNTSADFSDPSGGLLRSSSDHTEPDVRSIVTDHELHDAICARVSVLPTSCAG